MNARMRGRISARILLISAVAWVVLLVSSWSTTPLAHHAVTDSSASLAALQTHVHHSAEAEIAQAATAGATAMNSALSRGAALLAGWALMLVAMMSPTLIAPICHILERSFKRRRVRSVALFVSGYAAIWMAAGLMLIAIMLLLKLLIPQSYMLVVGVAIVAFVWQCAPIKQRCLNRGHDHRALAAFGFKADLDVLRFGITHGLWCVGSCWLLMLLPMLVSTGHIAAMAVVTFLMVGERLEAPRPLSWRLRPRGKLMRMIIAQTQIQMRRVQSRKLV